MKSKKVRIFIYSLVAWFVGMAVIMYDFAVSYAASFNDAIEDADWVYFQSSDTEKNVYNRPAVSRISSLKKSLPDYAAEYYDLKRDGYTYSDHFSFSYYDENWCTSDFTLISQSEVVFILSFCITEKDNDLIGFNFTEGGSFLVGLSKSRFCARSVRRFYSGDVVSNKFNGNLLECDSGQDGYYYSYLWDMQMTLNYKGSMEYAFKSGKFKVFSSIYDAYSYFETGNLDGLAWQGKNKEYDGDNIYLNDFQMIVHDSNAYSAYYLEFKYTIPEQLRDAASLKLDIAETFEWTITGLSSLVAYPRNSSGTNYIDLLQNPTGFKLYLDDIDVISKFVTDIPIASTVSRRAVLGSEIAFDTSGISIGGLGGETVVKITNSKMYLTCYVVANNKYGVSYNGSLDFVSGYNDMSSYTPDSSGNYKYNDDIKKQGHYYTDVSTDAAGNVTYNYYYYGDDNSKTEISAKDSADNTLTVVPGQTGSIINNITMPDHIFVSVSGGSGSGGSSSGSGVGDVTIEDDDLSFDSLRESIKDGYGLIDDTDTGEKGDGLVAMMSDLFGYLPASFTGLIMLGMSSVVGIAILRMIFKR